ncbi:MAG: hypothetical protein U0326_10025 [Polyangiales bacterium]
MKRDDTLDRTRWRAWSWGATPDDLSLDEPAQGHAAHVSAEAPPAPRTEEELAARRTLLEDRARDIEEAWRTRDTREDRSAVVALLRRSVDFLEMADLASTHPRAAVRALRLLVSLWATPEARAELDELVCGLGFTPVDHPEAADLVVEVVRTGSHRLLFHLNLGLDDEFLTELHPSLGAKLALEVETARSWRPREFALRFLADGDWREGDTWLHKALRWPHLECRWTALEGLLEGGVITADEVAWLLDDALAHPIDEAADNSGKPQRWYSHALAKAVLRTRPANAIDTLTRLVRHEGARINHERWYLAEAWALETLATVAPDRARELIDHTLRNDHPRHRYGVIAALASLPDDFARRRLVALASDHHHDIAEAAREAWAKRFVEPCPVDVFSGLAMELLDAPPSREFEARVRVLRGQDNAARRAMTRVTLASPPSRESLVLTLFAKRFATYGIEGAPLGDDAWIAWLRERHGDLALDGLLLEARCRYEGRSMLTALARLAKKGALSERHARALGDVVLARLDADGDRAEPDVVAAACDLPPRDEMIRHFEAILAGSPSGYLRMRAADGLSVSGPDAALDARLSARFFAARAAGDRAVASDHGSACIRRRVEAVIAAILDDLTNLDAPEAEKTLALFACILNREGILSDAAVVEALRDPSALRFARLASVVPSAPPFNAQAIERLRAALAPEVSGRSAARALTTLLWERVIAPDDPIVAEVYERAPRMERVGLLDCLTLKDKRRPAAHWQARFAELLTCGERDVVEAAVDCTETHSFLGWDDDWIEAMIDALPAGDLRDRFARNFERPTEADSYWILDDAEEDDAEEDDDGADDREPVDEDDDGGDDGKYEDDEAGDERRGDGHDDG